MSRAYIRPLFSRLYDSCTRDCDAADIGEDIRRNVEAILNTRLPYFFALYRTQIDRTDTGSAGDEAAIEQTVLNLGMIDFNLLTTFDELMQAHFLASLLDAIRTYEPRLERQSLRVTFAERSEFRCLNLRIEGRQVKPYIKPVHWQTGPGPEERLFRVEEMATDRN